MSCFPFSRKRKKDLNQRIKTNSTSRGIQGWAIGLIFTLGFNPGAVVLAQTAKETHGQTQATSQPILIAQQDSESQPETSSPEPSRSESNSESQPETSSPEPSRSESNSESKPETSSPEPSRSESNSESKPETSSPEPSHSNTATNWPMMLPPVLSQSDKSNMVSEVVRLDGRTVFSVAALDSDRDKIIERNLNTVLQSNFDPKTLRVYYKILNNLPVIYVTGENQSESIYILTVTSADAQIQGIEEETLANRWTEQLQQTFRIAYKERQPAALKKQVTRAGLVVFIMVLSSGSLISIKHLLEKKHEKITEKIPPDPETTALESNAENSEEPEISPAETEELAALLKQRVTLLQKRNLNEIEQGLLPVGQVGIWGIGTYITLGIFPYTRWIQPVILSILPIPIQLIVTGFSTYVAIRLSRIGINRFFAALENRKFQAAGSSDRLTLRFSTFSSVFKNLSSGLIIGVGFLVSLSVIGINIAPLLAGAGILGLGISLGSQSLIKDTINGFLILFEDQYAVGDVIVVGDVGGLVENMNLRITQLRNGEGRLITIPNSAITVVQNISKEWARVDLTLDVSYQSDVEKAFATIKEVLDEIYQEPEWREKIIDEPQLLGIDRMDHAGIMIRVWIKVKPLQHWSVGRECRRRLKPRLDRVGILIGTPQRALLFNDSLDLLSLKDKN
jgi:small-conductance mechanosensitive channel